MPESIDHLTRLATRCESICRRIPDTSAGSVLPDHRVVDKCIGDLIAHLRDTTETLADQHRTGFTDDSAGLFKAHALFEHVGRLSTTMHALHISSHSLRQLDLPHGSSPQESFRIAEQFVVIGALSLRAAKANLRKAGDDLQDAGSDRRDTSLPVDPLSPAPSPATDIPKRPRRP